MERFDLDFHILTPGGAEHIMRVEGGVVTIIPPAVQALAADVDPQAHLRAAPLDA